MARATRRVILGILIAIVLGGIVAYVFWPSSVLVETAKVSRGPLQVAVNEEGQTRVHDRFVLSSPVAGRLMRITLEDGDTIQRNEVVARIEPVPLSQREREEVYARVKAAEAALRQARAREAHAREDSTQVRRDGERAEQLAKSGVISAQALEQARNADITAGEELSAAESGVQVAASEEKIARAGLVGIEAKAGSPASLIELRSPRSSRVLRVLEKSERVIPMGTPILILGDSADIEIVTEVLSTDAVKIAAGNPVSVDGWGGGRPLRARVRLVEPYGFTKISALGVEEQRVNVISDFLDRSAALGDGYRVETHIVIWTGQNVMKVPISAIFRHGQNWSVYVIAGKYAQLRDVEVGHRNEAEAEIQSGLSEGDRVVVHPPSELRAGMRVRLEE